MKFRNFLGLVSAAAISLALAGGASAEDKVVKIGAVFPMSGGAASIGVHAKAAFDVITDIRHDLGLTDAPGPAQHKRRTPDDLRRRRHGRPPVPRAPAMQPASCPFHAGTLLARHA